MYIFISFGGIVLGLDSNMLGRINFENLMLRIDLLEQ